MESMGQRSHHGADGGGVGGDGGGEGAEGGLSGGWV